MPDVGVFGRGSKRVSVCMIVKDEEQTLARCLGCVSLFADEIVVVDTGSTDGTVQIAKRFTDKIYFFEWKDDFAAARNFSFSKATGDYVMWIDADDVITNENVGEISALINGAEFDTAYLLYAVAFNGEKPTFIYYRERIFRRSCNFKWEGEVHEAISPHGKIVYSKACIYHKKVKQNPTARNLKIYLNKLFRGEKLDPRQKFYYGRELYYNGLISESITVLNEFLEGDGWVENKIEACRTLYSAYVSLGRWEEAEKALLKTFTYSAPRAVECCRMGEYFEKKNDVRSAIYWYERALNIPSAASLGEFVNCDFSGFIPAIRLCVLYDKSGDFPTAERYNELAGSFRPDDKSYLFNKQYFSKKLTGKRD